RELRFERTRKTLLVDRLVADMAVEVAIRALGRTERPVDVDAETRAAVEQHGHLESNRDGPNRAKSSLACANFWKARARCDNAVGWPGFQPCFSSAVISPKVFSNPSGKNTGS